MQLAQKENFPPYHWSPLYFDWTLVNMDGKKYAPLNTKAQKKLQPNPSVAKCADTMTKGELISLRKESSRLIKPHMCQSFQLSRMGELPFLWFVATSKNRMVANNCTGGNKYPTFSLLLFRQELLSFLFSPGAHQTDSSSSSASRTQPATTRTYSTSFSPYTYITIFIYTPHIHNNKHSKLQTDTDVP